MDSNGLTPGRGRRGGLVLRLGLVLAVLCLVGAALVLAPAYRREETRLPAGVERELAVASARLQGWLEGVDPADASPRLARISSEVRELRDGLSDLLEVDGPAWNPERLRNLRAEVATVEALLAEGTGAALDRAGVAVGELRRQVETLLEEAR